VTASDIEEIVRLQQRLQSLIAKALDYRPGHTKHSSANFAADEMPVVPTNDEDNDGDPPAAGLAAMHKAAHLGSSSGSDDDPDLSSLQSFWP
jgi:hypothetical protein